MAVLSLSTTYAHDAAANADLGIRARVPVQLTYTGTANAHQESQEIPTDYRSSTNAGTIYSSTRASTAFSSTKPSEATTNYLRPNSVPNETISHRLLKPARIQLKIILAYFLIGIAALSLFGWAYIFYMRYKYSKKLQVEEEQMQYDNGRRVNTCCQSGRGDVFPIKLKNSPSRSPGPNEIDGDFPSPSKKHQHKHRHHRPNHNGHTYNTSSVMSHGESSAPSHARSVDISTPKEEDEDDDSFARELQVAARADQHTWTQFHGNQKALMAKKKFVPSLKPSAKDVEHISTEHFGNVGNLFGQSPGGPSYLPTKFQAESRPQRLPQNPMDKNHHSSEEFYDSPREALFDSRNQKVRPMHHYPHPQHEIASIASSDPSDVIFPSEDSSANDLYSSATSDSYAGKSSSVEEGEHGGDGFHVVGYHRGVKDEMNTYLLNPMPAGDDGSFGNSSGMEMSLGANTAVSSASEMTQGTAQGRGSVGRGFFVIDGENDLTDEYIPKEEYDAAVRAAATTLLNSPRNSPRKSLGAVSGTRGISEADHEGIKRYPSDERNGEFSSSRYSDGFSISEGESTSFDPRTAHSSSIDTSSDPTLSNDIYKELKSVSNFIRKFERKQSKRAHNIHENSTFDLSTDTSTFVSSSSQPSLQLTNTSKTSGSSAKSKEERKRRFLRPTFSRRKKGYVHEDDFSDLEVKVKSKKKKHGKKYGHKNQDRHALPPRHSNSISYDQEDDDDVVMMANHHRPEGSQRRQLPVAGNGQLPEIGLSPSGESGASDTKFLHNEIESFFSQNDSSMPVMSQSIERLHRPNVKNSQPTTDSNPNSETPHLDSSYGNDSSFFTEDASPVADKGVFSRLGAAPFDPKESHLARSTYEDPEQSPPKSVRAGGRRRKNSISTPPLASSKNDTQRVYPQTTSHQVPVPVPRAQHDFKNDSSQVPLSHSARTMLQTGAKNIASMIDRTRQSPKQGDLNPSHDFDHDDGASGRFPPNQRQTGSDPDVRQNGLPGLETKLQNSAKSLLNIFETKNENRSIDERSPGVSNSNVDHKMSDRISNRLDQIRRNVKERSSQGTAPRRYSSNASINDDHVPYTKSKNVVQVATFVNPDEMISPASIGVRTEREPVRILQNDSNTTQQSGDFTTESGQVNLIDSGSKAAERSTGTSSGGVRVPASKLLRANAGSTTGSAASNAKSLISMFESRRSNGSVGIFPPGENWQSGISKKLFK